MPSKMIVVSFQFEGFHNWPNAPQEHAYLRTRHRHMFHVKAGKKVYGDDREIEFIALKRQMEEKARQWGPEFDTQSCERLANNFIKEFDLDYCQVMEDGENGALVTA